MTNDLSLDWKPGQAFAAHGTEGRDYLGFDGSRWSVLAWSGVWGWVDGDGEPGVWPLMALLPTEGPSLPDEAAVV